MSNRTYRYFAGRPLFAFGHGLSYTTFSYQVARLNGASFKTNDTVKLTFTVKNDGKADGDEVPQVYVRHPRSAVSQPRLSLCGFTRVHLPQGRSAQITIEIPVSRLCYWDVATKQYVVEPGDYEFLVGAASDDIRLRVPLKILPDKGR
jgi:beta-glucosidase